MHSLSRRKYLKNIGAAGVTLPTLMNSLSSKQLIAEEQEEKRFLFVMACFGGGSIIDSFLPILDTESKTGINTFTSDQLVQPFGSNFRCPNKFKNSIARVIPMGDSYEMATFLSKHAQDTAVMTSEVSSVNHAVGARRAVTGDGINKGKTIQELVTEKYGTDTILPNCNMAGADYGGQGDDPDVHPRAISEFITDPRYFALSTHGFSGVKNRPAEALISRARLVRGRLEQSNEISKGLRQNPMVQRYLKNRNTLVPSFENSDLINKLLTLSQSPNGDPLSNYGLNGARDASLLAERFPNLQVDPFEAQVALAYLLVKTGVSTTVTLGPPGTPYITPENEALTAPIGFDWSHVDHRAAQNAMWGRILNMTDQLIELLKSTEYKNGSSLWDRSLIYVATEFGRDKVKRGSSGHHLNNGNVLISPFLKGNRVYGGVDPDTALTYGFDRKTGDPLPGTLMHEADVYSAIAQAMNVSFQGIRDLSCMVKA